MKTDRAFHSAIALGDTVLIVGTFGQNHDGAELYVPQASCDGGTQSSGLRTIPVASFG